MNTNFTDFVERKEIIKFLEWYEENVLEEGRLKNFLLTAPLLTTSFLGGGASVPPTTARPAVTRPAITRPAVNPQSELLAKHINWTYRTNVKPSDIHWIKPSEMISPIYGNKWNDVVSGAKKAQQEPTNYGTEESPFMMSPLPSSGPMDTNKLETPVPVIFADPTLFGQDKNTQGFCKNLGGKEFCVVRDQQSLGIIRHELSHTTQDKLYDTSLVNDQGEQIAYLSNEAELGVRIAEMKRTYYQLTGQIANRKTAADMLKHFLSTPEKYGRDVQQVKELLEYLIVRDKDAFKRVVEFIRDNVDKVVGNQNVKGRQYA